MDQEQIECPLRVGLDQRQLSSALCQARAACALAFGDLQAQLLHELLTQLKAHNAPAMQTMPVQASLDQLEASLRQLRTRMPDASWHSDPPPDP